MKEIREVRIVRKSNCWAVEYVHRVKHGRYWAAQFSPLHLGKADVEKWVKSRPNLKLTESE